MKVTLADIQAAVKASSGANEESCLNAEDVLLNKSYMLYGGMGKQAEAEQLMREAVHVKELLDETSETSYVWTLEDLIGCLCSERKAKDAMPFIDKLRQAPDYRILLSMDSDGHAFIGVPKAFKDQGLTDGYKTIIDWLVELGNAELHGHSPTFMHVRMILRSLIECDEIDKANRLIDEALLRYPSGPEAGTLNSLKCQKL